MKKTKTALITGAAGDIGSNVARRLNDLGFRLILIDIDNDGLQHTADTLENATILPIDLCNRPALKALCHDIETHYGQIDLAFINAGAVVVGDILDLDAEQIDLQLELNLRSTIHLIKACASNMSKHRSGHIISTVSMGGIVALKGSASYAASKFGLRGFLTGIRDELAPLGIHVSGIYPSGVDTQMLRYEAHNGGSHLNFISPPLTPDDVGIAVIKTLKTQRLEVYLPYSESIGGRLVSCFPWMLTYLYPLLEWYGKRGLKRYLKHINPQS